MLALHFSNLGQVNLLPLSQSLPLSLSDCFPRQLYHELCLSSISKSLKGFTYSHWHFYTRQSGESGTSGPSMSKLLTETSVATNAAEGPFSWCWAANGATVVQPSLSAYLLAGTLTGAFHKNCMKCKLYLRIQGLSCPMIHAKSKSEHLKKPTSMFLWVIWADELSSCASGQMQEKCMLFSKISRYEAWDPYGIESLGSAVMIFF